MSGLLKQVQSDFARFGLGESRDAAASRALAGACFEHLKTARELQWLWKQVEGAIDRLRCVPLARAPLGAIKGWWAAALEEMEAMPLGSRGWALHGRCARVASRMVEAQLPRLADLQRLPPDSLAAMRFLALEEDETLEEDGTLEEDEKTGGTDLGPECAGGGVSRSADRQHGPEIGMAHYSQGHRSNPLEHLVTVGALVESALDDDDGSVGGYDDNFYRSGGAEPRRWYGSRGHGAFEPLLDAFQAAFSLD